MKNWKKVSLQLSKYRLVNTSDSEVCYRRLRWAGHESGETRNAYKISVGELLQIPTWKTEKEIGG
jgi:hypothetical protein